MNAPPILGLRWPLHLFFALLTVVALAWSGTPAFAQTCPPGEVPYSDPATGVVTGCVLEYAPPTPEADKRGANALALFYYSMGRTADGTAIAEATCLSCDFITYFTTAMANFSAAIFIYFQEFFIVLAPLLMAGWIAVRVIRLNMAGGQGGSAFFSDMIRKLALFFFAWIVLFNGFGLMGPALPGHGSGTTYFAGAAWHITAPSLLEYSFDLNSDIRSRTAAGLMDVGAGSLDMSPFTCTGLDARISGLVNNKALDPAITSITQTACVVERMHALGLSTGVALVTSAWYQIGVSDWAILSAVFKSIWGLLLLGVYGLSAVWLVFLLLDVVTTALIVSAFLPLFGMALLFPATKDISMRAMRQFLSVPIVAFALGLTSLLGFFLIMGTVETYQASYALMSATYNSTLQPIDATGTIPRFAEFIQRIQLDKEDVLSIPADATAPWLHYLVLVGLGIFTLGKKIVSTIQDVFDVSNTTTMADNAKKMAMMGAGLALATTGMAVKAAATAAPVVGQVAAMGGGAATYALGATVRGLGGKSVGNSIAAFGGNVARRSASALNKRANPWARKE